MNNKIKYIAIIGIGIVGLKEIFTGSILGGLFLILASLLIYSPFYDIIKKKSKLWDNKIVRISSIIVCFFLGIGLSGGFDDLPSNERDRERIIINYIKTNKQDKSIQNIQKFGDIGYYFGNSNSSIMHPHDGYISEKFDSIANIYTLTFNPKFFRYDRSEDIKYLKDDKKNGRLTNYIIHFLLNSKDSIISKKTTLTFSKSGEVTYNNIDVPDITAYLKQDVINKQKEKIAQVEREKAETDAFNKRVKEFEERCFYTAYDGSHRKLKELIKENLNDPSSFEYIETHFKIFKGYAVVKMKYRARNSFNAKVLGTAIAKISTKDCSIIEISQYN